jgi:hypothetical protein
MRKDPPQAVADAAKADKAIRGKVYDSMDGTSLRCKSLILSDIALGIKSPPQAVGYLFQGRFKAIFLVDKDA